MGISKCTRSSGILDFQQNEWRNNHNSLTTSLIPENEERNRKLRQISTERVREREREREREGSAKHPLQYLDTWK